MILPDVMYWSSVAAHNVSCLLMAAGLPCPGDALCDGRTLLAVRACCADVSASPLSDGGVCRLSIERSWSGQEKTICL